MVYNDYMAASEPAAHLLDESEASPLSDGDFITRTEFELAIKQLLTQFVKILVRSHKNEIGNLEALLKETLKH